MHTLGRRLVLAGGLAGAILAGQAPELAQQYRQRLGGAIEELRPIVEQFDADAARNGLTRQEALGRYLASNDSLLPGSRTQHVGLAARPCRPTRRQAPHPPQETT